jgi:hypothetical protein
MSLPPFLANIIGWLRAGYPYGVPASDYVPLLALLKRRLSDDEVRQIATELLARGELPIDLTDIGVTITKVTDEIPVEADVERVRKNLNEGGWPVADPFRRDGLPE